MLETDMESNCNVPAAVEKEPVAEEVKKETTTTTTTASPKQALLDAQAMLRSGQYDEALALAGQEGVVRDRAWATLRYGAHVRLKQFGQALMELQLRVVGREMGAWLAGVEH